MSYNTFSIITLVGDGKDYSKLHTDIERLFPQAKIRKIVHPFNGIVGQVDLRNIDKVDFEEALQPISAEISKLNPDKKIAFVEVDCFGGQCTSEGKVMLDGEVILDEEIDHIAHVKLLKLISDNYQTWHFEPFTREYFDKKGGIWGQINDGPLKFFGLGLAVAYKDNPLFRVDMTMNELLIQKFGKFTLYLMEPLENTIKVLGSVYDDSAETLDEITAIINEHILYTKAYVFIELIDKGEIVKMDNFGEDGFRESLYRFKSFNDRPFPEANSKPVASVPKRQERRKEEDHEEDGPSKSFWETIKWFFGK
ncbi:MAG: hypothetical protein M3O71_31335 [Bacteroidota bacterium]|nr:hypothetical protein [Bacteroidota bacterium]